MLTYSEMVRPSMNRFVENVVMMNDALAEVLFSLTSEWVSAHERIGKRMLSAAKPGPKLSAPAPAPEQPSAEASLFQAIAGPSEPREDDTGEIAAAAASGEDSGGAEEGNGEAEAGAKTETEAALNAAADLMEQPAMEADAAAPEGPGADIEEVHDDVSDDIANEIEREAAEEVAAPALAEEKPAAAPSVE